MIRKILAATIGAIAIILIVKLFSASLAAEKREEAYQQKLLELGWVTGYNRALNDVLKGDRSDVTIKMETDVQKIWKEFK